jgi:hypothetical protein
MARRSPGVVRDAIIAYMRTLKGAAASVGDIHRAVEESLGGTVPASSVRSYLNLNPKKFARLERGRYRLIGA